MTDDLMARFKDETESNEVIIYMKGSKEFPQCGFSASTVQVFQSLGHPFATVNVLDDPAVWEGIKVFSEWPTIPQVFIGGTFIGGCDIVHELHERNELMPMVKAAFKE